MARSKKTDLVFQGRKKLRLMNVVSTLIKVLLMFFVFFSGKSLKICSLSFLIFRDLTSDSFQVHCISIVKKEANSSIEQQI